MIAKASQMAKEWICDGASIIARFIGSTRDSTSLHLLLQSICLELSLAYQTDPAAVPQVSYLTKVKHGRVRNNGTVNMKMPSTAVD